MIEYTFSEEQKNLLMKPFYIAEISCNHMNDYKILQDSVKAAFGSNAHSVKLQSSVPDSLTRKFGGSEFVIDNKSSPWNGKHLYDLYIETCTPLRWPVELIKKHREINEIVFSTPFSPDMVSMLEENASPDFYKVSSIDWNYIDLIRQCCETNKPVFISLVKPSEQLPLLLSYGFNNLIPMLCISQYPSKPFHMDFSELLFLRKFEIFGFSDHSLTASLSSLAIAHGATVIEKHFMLDSNIVSADAHFSLTPQQFRQQTIEWNEIYEASQSKSNDTTIPVGRSIYVDVNLREGEIITKDKLCVIRPGGGISPLEIDAVIGKKAKTNLVTGHRLALSDLV